MSSVLTPRQVEAVGRLMSGDARPEDVELVRGVTADDLDAHADHLERVLGLHQALRDAYLETGRLVEEHGVASAGELRRLGVAVPADEVLATIARAHAKGEIGDDELRRLGLGDAARRISVAAA